MKIEYLSLKKVTDLHREEIHDAVNSVVASGQYLQAEQTKGFENEYAAYLGSRHCVGCGNGLDALTLIFRAYKEMGKLKDGDEILVPANTYIASILAITENGLKPVLVEPYYSSLEIDDFLMQRAITPRCKALLLVHLYGRCAMNEAIAEACRRHNLLLIEDNAQAHGCTYNQLKTGHLGHAAAHSFYPTKNLGALGDAGCVTTDCQELATLIRTLGNYGAERKHYHSHKGVNSRMDELQAAVLRVKLKYLDKENARRKAIAEYMIANIDNPKISLSFDPIADNVHHIFPVFSNQRNDLQAFLLTNGIETAIHYPVAPHRQRCYKGWNKLSFPITELLARTELSIPCNPTLTDNEVEYIVETLNRF
ncbi:DegT/DnrJ/EryC1/StrS family aminotransferase [Prevotella sp.]|uniref:DegT/DnrJ/EryC1/StrS family aminotransferase n=1 Tax=Prevotella sp. TaxID=59823 RepID=UPI002F93A74B